MQDVLYNGHKMVVVVVPVVIFISIQHQKAFYQTALTDNVTTTTAW